MTFARSYEAVVVYFLHQAVAAEELCVLSGDEGLAVSLSRLETAARRRVAGGSWWLCNKDIESVCVSYMCFGPSRLPATCLEVIFVWWLQLGYFSSNSSTSERLNSEIRFIKGKYLAIPHLTWYHYSKSKFNPKSKFTSVKKFPHNFFLVFTRCVFIFSKFFRTKYEMHRETKEKLLRVSFFFFPFCDTICVGFAYFVSKCISNLVLKILGIVNTRLVNTHKFISDFFFETCKFEFWEVVSWEGVVSLDMPSLY